MEKYSELGSELDRLLKLRTPSLGIKLLKQVGDVPGGVEPLSFPCAVCQATATARYYSKPVLISKQEGWACQMGGAALGFWDFEDDFKTGARNAGMWAADAKATARLIEGDVIKAGSFSAALIAPLMKMSVEPDVVLVYGSPAQMLRLVYGTTWLGGDRVKLSTNGHGSTCRECIAAPYLHKELRLSITDIGERKFGLAYDYEMVAGLPYAHLSRLVEGLKGALIKGIYSYPVAPYGLVAWPEAALNRTGLKGKI